METAVYVIDMSDGIDIMSYLFDFMPRDIDLMFYKMKLTCHMKLT